MIDWKTKIKEVVDNNLILNDEYSEKLDKVLKEMQQNSSNAEEFIRLAELIGKYYYDKNHRNNDKWLKNVSVYSREFIFDNKLIRQEIFVKDGKVFHTIIDLKENWSTKNF